jgi:hypothetical protein
MGCLPAIEMIKPVLSRAVKVNAVRCLKQHSRQRAVWSPKHAKPGGGPVRPARGAMGKAPRAAPGGLDPVRHAKGRVAGQIPPSRCGGLATLYAGWTALFFADLLAGLIPR